MNCRQKIDFPLCDKLYVRDDKAITVTLLIPNLLFIVKNPKIAFNLCVHQEYYYNLTRGGSLTTDLHSCRIINTNFSLLIGITEFLPVLAVVDESREQFSLILCIHDQLCGYLGKRYRTQRIQCISSQLGINNIHPPKEEGILDICFLCELGNIWIGSE